jgi:orotate phosphoribosyltransferase
MGLSQIIERNTRDRREGVTRVYNGALKRTSLPCVNLGGILEYCHTCAGHVRECDVHGKCTLEFVSDKVMNCVRCKAERLGYEPAEPVAFPSNGLEWVTTERLAADSIKLAALLPRDIVGVVGLPRSGMIPASIIATHLHLPLYELTHEGRLNRLGHGSRGRSMGFRHPETGRLAVIDDTVYGGYAMRQARESMAKLKRPAVYAVVYSRLQALPESQGAADIFAAALPTPHLLEWNAPNNGPFVGHTAADGVPYYRAGVACDLDGIIIHDAESGGKIGEAYLVPRTHPCRLIVTGRRERFRAGTEAHLKALGVQWDRLEMLPDDAPETTQSFAEHKAKHYGASECGFFFESCPLQAELIHHLTGRPVVCPKLAKVWHKDMQRSAPAPLLPLSAVAPIFAPLVGKRVALVHSPRTGNCGDRLIERAAEQLLTRFGIEYQVTEPDAPGDADVICLFGGGNFGHANCRREAGRRAAALATGKPCVLLPQTAYGPEPWHGTAFVRDVQSLRHIPGATLAPDLVMCYQPERPLPPPRFAVGEFFSRLKEGLNIGRGIDPRHQFTDPRDYLDFVAMHAEIHTDSLHCAILGLIAKRRVTLYPTSLPKQRGVWEAWLRDLGCEWSE